MLELSANAHEVTFRATIKGRIMKILLHFSGVAVLLPWILIMAVFQPQDNTMHLANALTHTEDSRNLVIAKTSQWLKMKLFQVSSSCYSGAYWAILFGFLAAGGYFLVKRKILSRHCAQLFLPMLLFILLYLAFTYLAFLSSNMDRLEDHLISIPRLWLPPCLILLLWISYSKETPIKRSKK